jgi:hypothetical protein
LIRRPKVGEEVRVTWIDSGMSTYAAPKDIDKVKLHIANTYGRVLSLEGDVLVLAMCSSGPDDDRSELAGIWWPAVREVKVLK